MLPHVTKYGFVKLRKKNDKLFQMCLIILKVKFLTKRDWTVSETAEATEDILSNSICIEGIMPVQ